MLRSGKRLAKYRIQRRLASGGFADVYDAYDTIEGIRVALKIPIGNQVTTEMLDLFRHEVKVNAQLDHPNVLPIKNAGFCDDHFVIVYPLGEESLAHRLKRRLSFARALDWATQLLSGLAFAHERKIIHCDVKPENLILFSGGRLRLADFGIARFAQKTVAASGSGTIEYIAPEQAMGWPSARSDVFGAGLVIYRMLTGHLPRWPFEWPPPGHERLRRGGPALTALLRRALQVDARKRYRDAAQMLQAFRRIRPQAVARSKMRSRPQRTTKTKDGKHWREIRVRQFKRRFGRDLDLGHQCTTCGEPLDERMLACPWCGTERREHDGETRLPASCPRCARGVKLDWIYCPWCWGGRIGPLSEREYTDRRYSARCAGPRCNRRSLMPFMRYCPWCRAKVKRRWPLAASRASCPRCGNGVASGFWACCAWCGVHLETT